NRHRWVVQLKWAAAIVLVYAMVLWVIEHFTGRWAPSAMQFGINMAWATIGVAAGAESVKRAGRKAVDELLKSESCPTCGYSIKGLKTEGDGCWVCPECGGAWRGDSPNPEGGIH